MLLPPICKGTKDVADYSGLVLEKSAIEAAVHAFPGNTNHAAPTEGKGFKCYTIEVEGQEKALLNVYERGDGKFTLTFKTGKNHQLSEQVAKHVAEQCACDPVVTKPLSLKSISEADWTFLQESLVADGFALQEEPLEHGKRFKVAGPGKDHVYLHRFNTGAFLMQGKTRGAYSAVVQALSYTGTEQKELIDSQLATINVKGVESNTLLTELEGRIPSAWQKMDETVKTILAPALLVHKMSVDIPDYSLMAFPALRGLEGAIKDLFGRKGYYLGSKLNVGDQFDSTSRHVKADVKAKIGNCADTSEAAELVYSVFSKHRNGLLHVDNVLATTRIIEKQSEAAQIVDQSLHAIENAYAKVN